MIEKTISTIVNELIPSSGDNLLGMDYDICHYFEISDTLKFVSRKQTDDVTCMFVINLEASSEANDLNDIVHGLRETWACLMYSHFEATSVQKFKKHTILRFVTIIDANKFYVTGKAVVSGARYEQLAKSYETSFGVLKNA